jgi:phenylalanine-4-hydroxylase
MAVGEKIVSAYSGPADPYAFELQYPVPKEKTHKIIHTEKAARLHQLYQNVRNIREDKSSNEDITSVWKEVKENYQEEWLLPLEILELVKDDSKYVDLSGEIREFLLHARNSDPNIKRLVDNGMLLFEQK